ncbi:hypothetical protein D9M71_763260 [compost metagenome]
MAYQPKANAATKAKPAKKNIRNAASLSPVLAILWVTVSLRTAALDSSTHRLPMVVVRFQKLITTPFIACGAWL